MKQSYRLVRERVNSIQLCAVVEFQNEGSVAFSFNIKLLFESDNNSASVYYMARIILRCRYHIHIRISFSSFTDINDDFVPPSRRYLTFEPMNSESCVTVAITDSVDIEMPESFFVALQKPSGLDECISINTTMDETEVEILDDDGA